MSHKMPMIQARQKPHRNLYKASGQGPTYDGINPPNFADRYRVSHHDENSNAANHKHS